jgi:hypothetical protein
MTSTNELQALLKQAVHDDYHEEPAVEFLQDHGICYFSHSRQYLIELAYRNGWRPAS